jgi:hypothetical protein
MARYRRNFYYVQSLFEEPASRFVSQIVEAHTDNVRSVRFAGSLKGLAHRLSLQ